MPMFERTRARAFAWLGHEATASPLRVLVVVGLVVAAFTAMIPGIGVSTSRSALVAEDDPQRRRAEAFYEDFGRPDYPLFVVSGGDSRQRHAVVDALETRLNAQEQFHGRVFARLRPRDVAGVALLVQPTALTELLQAIPSGAAAHTFVERGLVGWLEATAGQLEAGLDGKDAATLVGSPDEGLGRLAGIADLLERVVATGELPNGMLTGLSELPGASGMDASGYVATTDRAHNLVAVFADVRGDEGEQLAPMVDDLRRIRDDVLADAPAEIRASLTGLPALAVDELRIVQRGLWVSSAVAAAGIVALCLLLFRSLRQTIIAMLPLLPGVLMTLALVRLFYGSLSIVTSSFPAVLLGLGIDFSVHVLARRNEEVRGGASEPTASRAALMRAGPGVWIGAKVTAIAFATSATTEFQAFRELGVVTSLGLLLMAAVTFALVPAVLAVSDRGNRPIRVAPEPPGIARLSRWICVRARWVLVLGLVGAGAGALFAHRVAFNSRYFDFLPASTESTQGLAVLEYDPTASPVFAAFEADSLEQARLKAESLRSLDAVAGVQTPSDVLPPLSSDSLAALRTGLAALEQLDLGALADAPASVDAVDAAVRDIADALEEVRFALKSAGQSTAAARQAAESFERLAQRIRTASPEQTARLQATNVQAAQLLKSALETARSVASRGAYAPSDLPPALRRRFVSRDGSKLALFAVPSGQFWNESVGLEFARQVREIDADAIGLAMVHVEHGRQIREGFERAAVAAAGLILALLVFEFRSLILAGLALLPTVVGWLWMLGIMAWAGFAFDVANIVALPLTIGVGVAFGVHVVHRLKDTGPGATADDVLRGTGGAVAVAATTTMVGFASLMLGQYGGMVSLGATMVLGIGCCLVATLLVLPAALLVLGKLRA